MRETYPLRWPDGWPRTQKPQSSQFMTGLGDAIAGLDLELQRLGARDAVLTTMRPRNQDGRLSKVQPKLMDQGIAVYFTLNGEERCIPCDKWMTLADNIHAIELTIAALRGLERWGARQMVDAAFAGFAALPAGGTSGEAWWEVLDVENSTFPQRVEIEDAYRRLAKTHHPDVGGDIEQWHRIQAAYEQGRKAVQS